jgi:stalled ribosome rescue protein Dom34
LAREAVQLTRKRGYRRGFPVAVLIGLEVDHAILWRVFSNVVKPNVTLRLSGTRAGTKALYSFHEAIVDALRPALKEGVKSIVVAAPMKTDYPQVFLDHIRKHYAWLVQASGPNSATFGVLVGSASKPHEVAELVKTKRFRDLMSETTSADADRIVDALEKGISDVEDGAVVLYSLEEVENLIYGKWSSGGVRPEYLMLTDEYLLNHREKSRINRLMQISNNKNVKTMVVDADTPAGNRLKQFGGLVCLARSTRTDSSHQSSQC